MTHKIAIVMADDGYGYSGSYDHDTVITSITEWTEVTDEEFRLLSGAKYEMGFAILEQPVDTPAFVAKTVKDYIVLVEKRKQKEEEEKRKQEEAALQRKIKKQAKDQESKLKLLKKLSDELGVPLIDK